MLSEAVRILARRCAEGAYLLWERSSRRILILNTVLPEIGEYRVPIIFVNKKSNFSIKNLNHSITTLLVFFRVHWNHTFALGKNQRSKFAKFILKLTFQKNFFAFWATNFIIIGNPIVKSMIFINY